MLATRNAPTFLESFQPFAHVGQAVGRGGSSPITALTSTMGLFNSQTTYARTTEQINRFTYWNYVALDLIANRASEPFPNLSYQKRAPASLTNDNGSVQSFLSHDDRQWIRQHYGLLQSEQDDLAPLPTNHPFKELLVNPNPDDTWNEFAYEHFMFFGLTGISYWWVIPNGFGLPSQVVVVPPQWIQPVPDGNGQIIKYLITPDGASVGILEIPADQIIISKKKSPKNKRDGYSAISAAPHWTTNSESIEASRHHSFRNGANPDVIVMLGETYADPDDAGMARIKEKFMRRASGVNRAGEPLIVPRDIKVDKWSNSPKEMDYKDSGDQARDNNLALHCVPKTLAGITTEVNRANVEASEAVFCSGKINPLLRSFAGTLTWMARRFDPRICVWYPDMTPADPKQGLAEDVADFSMGALDPDELRQKRGRKVKGEPAYESGYLPTGLSPLAEELNQPDPGIDPATGLPIDPNAVAAATGTDPNAADPKTKDPKATKGKDGKPAAKPTAKEPKASKPAAKKQSGLTAADFDALDLETDDGPQF